MWMRHRLVIVDAVLALDPFAYKCQRYLYYINQEILSVAKAIEQSTLAAKNDLVIL
jgi:hypothetical protein